MRSNFHKIDCGVMFVKGITNQMSLTSEEQDQLLQNRNQGLQNLGQLVVNGQIIYKIDQIAMIHHHGKHLFSVFRRYNSVYEIVIEDCHGDTFFHKDYTLKESLQRLLCLSNTEKEKMYLINVHEFTKNAPYDHNVLEMRWSEVHRLLNGAYVNIGLVDDIEEENSFPNRYRCKRECCHEDQGEESDEEEEEEEEEEDEEENQHASWCPHSKKRRVEEISESEEEESEEEEQPVKYKILRNGKKIAVK